MPSLKHINVNSVLAYLGALTLIGILSLILLGFVGAFKSEASSTDKALVDMEMRLDTRIGKIEKQQAQIIETISSLNSKIDK